MRIDDIALKKKKNAFWSLGKKVGFIKLTTRAIQGCEHIEHSFIENIKKIHLVVFAAVTLLMFL